MINMIKNYITLKIRKKYKFDNKTKSKVHLKTFQELLCYVF